MSKVDINKVLNFKIRQVEQKLTKKDVALYAIGIGCGTTSLKYVYEGHSDFAAIPTIGVIFPGPIIVDIITDGIDGLEFEVMKLLHGEQELEILNDIPVEGTFITNSKINGIYDKGKGALLVFECITHEKSNPDKPIFRNIFSFFIRDIGGFGGKKQPPAVQIESIPNDKKPNAISKLSTSIDQAVIYRLAGGDLNPLHIDPSMSALGGFKVPILHGLCTFGFATRGIIEHFCNDDPSKLKSIKVRFTKHVFPGEQLETQLFKSTSDPNKILFQTKTSRDGTNVLSGGVAIIKGGGSDSSSIKSSL